MVFTVDDHILFSVSFAFLIIIIFNYLVTGSLFVLLLDLVDALSAPIQFMSQAEKRAKQMQEMGIDASDISEIPAKSSSSSASATAAVVKQTQTAVTAKPSTTPQNGARSSAPLTERSNSNTPSMQNAVNIDKKKGELRLISSLSN